MAPPARVACSIAFLVSTDERGMTWSTFQYARHSEVSLGLRPIILYADAKDPNVLARWRAEFSTVASYGLTASADSITNVTGKARQRAIAQWLAERRTRGLYTQTHGHPWYGYLPPTRALDILALPSLGIPLFVHAVFSATRIWPDATVARVGNCVPAPTGVDLPVLPLPVTPARRDGPNLRRQLGIPDDATVFCRHGGQPTFDIEFARRAVFNFAVSRPEVFFLFLNTRRAPHLDASLPNLIHLPAMYKDDEKASFVRTCDAMVHARSQGETFGLAVAEFSVANKPVLTYARPPPYARNHVDVLGARALLYRNEAELEAMLGSFNRTDARLRDWNAYRAFAPAATMTEFATAFGLSAPPRQCRPARRPPARAPTYITSCGVSLVRQHSISRCELHASFGCVDASTVWVSGCRGQFRCETSAHPFLCGYPAGEHKYTCSCNGGAASARDDRPALRAACASNQSVAVHVVGHTYYSSVSGAFAHFFRGHLLAAFGRLHRLCPQLHPQRWHAHASLDWIHTLTFDGHSMDPWTRGNVERLEWYRLLLPQAQCCQVLSARPAGALTLSLYEPEEGVTDCEYSPALAARARAVLSVPPRSSRPLAITLTRRNAGGRDRDRELHNWVATRAALHRFARSHQLAMQDHSPTMPLRAQLAIVAGTDLWVGMHGSGDTLTAFLPPRSLVINLMPGSWRYCLHAHCFVHEQGLWVAVRSESADAATAPKLVSARTGRSRHAMPWELVGFNLSIAPFIATLRRAWLSDMDGALNLSVRQPHPRSLESWMRGRPSGHNAHGHGHGHGHGHARSWGQPIAPIADFHPGARLDTFTTPTVNERAARRTDGPSPNPNPGYEPRPRAIDLHTYGALNRFAWPTCTSGVLTLP